MIGSSISISTLDVYAVIGQMGGNMACTLH
jgi:hypothetical protein